ncbi:MAG: class I poly(R)-hydroxyalkanoic acid synthase [Betaproteobacteria bacterium]
MAESPASNDPPAIDNAELQRAFSEIGEKSAKVALEFLATQPHTHMLRDIDELGIGKAFSELGSRWMANPSLLAEHTARAWEEQLRLWNTSLARFLGEPADPVRAPARGDNRFRAEAWESNFVFDYIKQSYLIAAEHIQRSVDAVQDLSPEDARKVRFFTRQYVDALAPTNFVLTNPEVLKTTLDTRGRNLLDGLKHLLEDLDRGDGKLAIRMTDESAFELGRNVATTKGKVVFENDLMQLLQFEPATAKVDRAPLLIVPPWINKYYILDLREKNSFIKWAVDQGLTVFVISWVNPDERHRHKTFADYLLEGPLAAMDAVQRATGERQLNLIGYCLGGTLSACLLSWLRARGEAERVKSVTFFTTMIDFREPGELGVFVDEAIVDNLEKRMQARGYLEGSEMSGTFNLLRDNDLVWSFVVNNYLLGKEPFPFDLLYWNSDSTRMPARMHTYYLRNMYIRNLLAKPGALELAGEHMDLGQVDTPAYFISTMEDHIAPWKSTYAGARLLGGPVRFVLGGSGHIAGIVNPPAAAKYNYWTHDTLPESADQWIADAERHDGSWWNDWAAWVHRFSGGQVNARRPGAGALPAIEDAPGRYAKLRLGAGEAGAKCAPVATPAAAAAPATPPSPPASPEAARPARKATAGAAAAPRKTAAAAPASRAAAPKGVAPKVAAPKVAAPKVAASKVAASKAAAPKAPAAKARASKPAPAETRLVEATKPPASKAPRPVKAAKPEAPEAPPLTRAVKADKTAKAPKVKAKVKADRTPVPSKKERKRAKALATASPATAISALFQAQQVQPKAATGRKPAAAKPRGRR